MTASSPSMQILDHVTQTLRAAGIFAEVRQGDEALDGAAATRAGVTLESVAALPAGHDYTAPTANRVTIAVTIHARHDKIDQAILRAGDLAAAATSALLADPYRGGLCHDLPAGRATVVLDTRPGDKAPSGQAQVRMVVQCHFQADDLPTAAITIDAMDLFSPGPAGLRAHSWQRQLERRTFPGLAGEMVLDLGARSRTIIQQGRLSAPTAAALHARLTQIHALADGLCHTLVDGDGHAYANVQLESFEPTTPVAHGRDYWCDYTLTWRQLP